MAIYRVGDEGATVFDAEGRAAIRLRPGMVVVPGTQETAKRRLDTESKRLRDYADKAIRPPEDKSVGNPRGSVHTSAPLRPRAEDKG